MQFTPEQKIAAEQECARIREDAWKSGYEAVGVTYRVSRGAYMVRYALFHRSNDELYEMVCVKGERPSQAFAKALRALPAAMKRIEDTFADEWSPHFGGGSA